jgi:hypothetical protein
LVDRRIMFKYLWCLQSLQNFKYLWVVLDRREIDNPVKLEIFPLQNLMYMLRYVKTKSFVVAYQQSWWGMPWSSVAI